MTALTQDFLTDMQNFIDHHKFLENECLRCYKELESQAAEIDLLQTQKMDLVEALANKTWVDMKQIEFKRQQARKWKAK